MTTQLDRSPTPTATSPDRSDRLFAAALAIVSARTVDEMLRETTARAAETIGTHQAVTSLTLDRDGARPLTATYGRVPTRRSAQGLAAQP
jgi:hypothetical protein